MKATFIAAYQDYARITEQKTGIPAAFTLAQAALESGWGKHAPGNNFFGIKAQRHTPSTQKQQLLTTEYINGKAQRVQAWFMQYDSPEACFTAHALLLTTSPRYRPALAFLHNPYRLAEAIAQAGYATSPHYAQQLIQTIKSIENLLP